MHNLILIFLFFSLQSIGQETHKLLFPNDFEKYLKTTSPLHLIDLRTLNEYDIGHIKKSINIDYLRSDFEDYIKSVYKSSTPLFLYCQTGNTSEEAGIYFSELGFTNVTILKGGFEKWISNSKPYTTTKKTFEPLSFISKENYITSVRDNKWVLVNFYDEQCEPCKKITLLLHKIDEENNELNLFKIDVKKNTGMKEQLEITETPTLILYKNGRQVWRQTGLVSEAEIKSKIF